MNFGSAVKKIAANINVSLKFYKQTGGCKPNCAGAVLGSFKSKNVSIMQEQLQSLSLCLNKKENVFFSFPNIGITKKSIIEPDECKKIKVELPLSHIRNKALELPMHIEKEIIEPPGQVIIKKAVHLLRIRRKKMKKHKRKKHQKKFRVQIQTRKVRQQVLEENKLQNEIRDLIESSQKFSVEKYITDTLEKYNWVRPVTTVRGRLAPDWVIKNHLKNEEEKKIFKERFTECIKLRK